jgi:XFP N-terminal domain
MTAITETNTAFTGTDIELLDAYWRAANYLSAGQIYLLDNPLLREPVRPEHIKPRLLGHWGTTPGLNLVYTHMNRLIRAHDLEAIFITGPGHGGPALVAQADPGAGGVAAGRDRGQLLDVSPVRPRRDRVQPALPGVRGHRPRVERRARAGR